MLINSTTATPIQAAPIPEHLIAAMFGCLALVPRSDRHDPALIIAIARTIASSESDAIALYIRIRAAAIVLRDPRWQSWAAHFRMRAPDPHHRFGIFMRRLIATMPVTSELRFDADTLFDAVLAGFSTCGVQMMPSSTANPLTPPPKNSPLGA